MTNISPPAQELTVGAMVAEFLQRCQVETAFGVISIHNTPMLDAVGTRANQLRDWILTSSAAALPKIRQLGRDGEYPFTSANLAESLSKKNTVSLDCR